VSPDLSGERTDDEEADVLAATGRVNDVLSRVIRERPEAWAWMLKRWKSRPTPELGPYPAYSLYDPDPETPGSD
jgi:lauroyl/myristoyl acyltransferase